MYDKTEVTRAIPNRHIFDTLIDLFMNVLSPLPVYIIYSYFYYVVDLSTGNGR